MNKGGDGRPAFNCFLGYVNFNGMDQHFGGVIWTNHALERLAERGIKQGDAWVTFQHPQSSRYAATEGAWVYYRNYGRWRIEVVAKQNERKEWLILSVWSRPVEGAPRGIPYRSKPDLLDRILQFFLGGLKRRLGRGNGS